MKWKILIAALLVIGALAGTWKTTPLDKEIGLRASNVLIGSYNMRAGPMTFRWRQVLGPYCIIDSPMRLKTKVREMNYPGRYEFEFRVMSQNGRFDLDTVAVNVKPPLSDQLAYNGKLVIVSRVNTQAEIKITRRVFLFWTVTYLNVKRDIKVGINYQDVPTQSGSFTAAVKYGGQTYSLKFSK